MDSLDIFVDVPLLREQYNFLLSRYEHEYDDPEAQEMWEGVLNLFETILETYNPIDNTTKI